MLYYRKCNCPFCKFIRGASAPGTCALCGKPGIFTASDTFILTGQEFWCHKECRWDSDAKERLARWLLGEDVSVYN